MFRIRLVDYRKRYNRSKYKKKCERARECRNALKYRMKYVSVVVLVCVC